MDLKKIEALLKLLTEYSVHEFHLQEGETSMELRLGAPAVVERPVGPTHLGAVAAPLPDPPPANSPTRVDDGAITVPSPMVGTFYRSSSPGAAAFVEVGATVKPGQVLCIVEAMKLMNEIESECAGVVTEVCVENAQPVQFGQALFKIRPH